MVRLVLRFRLFCRQDGIDSTPFHNEGVFSQDQIFRDYRNDPFGVNKLIDLLGIVSLLSLKSLNYVRHYTWFI